MKFSNPKPHLLQLIFWLALAWLLPGNALCKPLPVFACEPEWAALANALGGDKLEIYAATTALQDPHHIQARPSLIAKARNAKLLICTDAELEIGWLPILLSTSGNRDIQPGSPGHFLASKHVTLLDVPLHVDRSMGDVHPTGNPHLQLDPERMLNIANALQQVLASIDPAQADFYQQRYQQFQQHLSDALAATTKDRQILRGKRYIVYHDSWPYLMHWLGLQQLGTLEPKPGLPPSSRHLLELVTLANTQQPVAGIIYAPYQDPKPVHWLADKIHASPIALPSTVPNWQDNDALILWYVDIIHKLAAHNS